MVTLACPPPPSPPAHATQAKYLQGDMAAAMASGEKLAICLPAVEQQQEGLAVPLPGLAELQGALEHTRLLLRVGLLGGGCCCG